MNFNLKGVIIIKLGKQGAWRCSFLKFEFNSIKMNRVYRTSEEKERG